MGLAGPSSGRPWQKWPFHEGREQQLPFLPIRRDHAELRGILLDKPAKGLQAKIRRNGSHPPRIDDLQFALGQELRHPYAAPETPVDAERRQPLLTSGMGETVQKSVCRRISGHEWRVEYRGRRGEGYETIQFPTKTPFVQQPPAYRLGVQ